MSGSAHALVSAIEDLAPTAVMEEAIREIDGCVDEVRSELGLCLAGKHLANKRLMAESKRHDDLSEQIELAVSEKREDLAKAAIAKQFDIEAQIPILESTVTDASTREKELESYVSALLAKRREMQEELAHFRQEQSRQNAASGDSEAAGANQVERKAERAQNAFDRVLNRQAGLPNLRKADDPQSAAQLQELEGLSRNNRIEERLAQLKAQHSDND